MPEFIKANCNEVCVGLFQFAGIFFLGLLAIIAVIAVMFGMAWIEAKLSD